MVKPVLEVGLLTPHSALSTIPAGLVADKPGCAIENRLEGVFVSSWGLGGGRRILDTRKAV